MAQTGGAAGRRWAIFGLVACAVAGYYRWEVRAAGTDFIWNDDNLNGYYNLLTRGFAQGHLYMAADPNPALLALPDPVDPKAGLDLPKLFDAVLYNRRYYLYHGAGPAVMLFLPYRLLTNHDLPENYALYLFCLGGYLFSALTLMRLADVKPWLLAVMLTALACCTSIPFLLNRIWVYEIAIGGAYFCVSAALFFFVRKWYWAAGLMFGMAVACRPHMVIVGALAAIVLAITNRRRLYALLIPFALAGVAIAWYNFARFGNPLEFGLTYQITGEYQGRVVPRLVNVMPGLFYNLLAGPDFTKVFPWVLMPITPRIVPRPPEYFIEPIVGALFLAPFIPAALAVVFMRRLRAPIGIAPTAALGILFFLTLTGLSTQRYEVDFLPLLVLAALAVFAEWNNRGLNAALAAMVAFGVVINGAMGITGPYSEIVHNKPERYVKIARFFSPIANLRPQINPAFDAQFPALISKAHDHERRNLFFAGQPPFRYEVFLDQLEGKAVLVSSFHFVNVSREMPFSESAVPLEAHYIPQTGEAIVSTGGAELLRQKVGMLIAAPADIGPVR